MSTLKVLDRLSIVIAVILRRYVSRVWIKKLFEQYRTCKSRELALIVNNFPVSQKKNLLFD
jgi:hypothetical protein